MSDRVAHVPALECRCVKKHKWLFPLPFYEFDYDFIRCPECGGRAQYIKRDVYRMKLPTISEIEANDV